MRVRSLLLLPAIVSVVLAVPYPRHHDDKIGTPAPAFSGKTADGLSIELATYKGKVVFLDFWASWCGPCRREMPCLAELKRTLRDEPFEVIAVNIDDERENMDAFLKELKVRPTFPIVVDPEKKLPALYDIDAMPTSLVIDKKGIIRYWHAGFKDSDKARYEEEVSTLLSE